MTVNKKTMRDFALLLLIGVGGPLIIGTISARCHARLTKAVEQTRAASGCVAAADAAQNECGLVLSEEWYRAGADNVDRAQLMKNNDKCRNIYQATFRACKGGDDE